MEKFNRSDLSDMMDIFGDYVEDGFDDTDIDSSKIFFEGCSLEKIDAKNYCLREWTETVGIEKIYFVGSLRECCEKIRGGMWGEEK